MSKLLAIFMRAKWAKSKHQMDKVKSSQDLYHNENVSTDLISNNLNIAKSRAIHAINYWQ